MSNYRAWMGWAVQVEGCIVWSFCGPTISAKILAVKGLKGSGIVSEKCVCVPIIIYTLQSWMGHSNVMKLFNKFQRWFYTVWQSTLFLMILHWTPKKFNDSLNDLWEVTPHSPHPPSLEAWGWEWNTLTFCISLLTNFHNSVNYLWNSTVSCYFCTNFSIIILYSHIAWVDNYL